MTWAKLILRSLGFHWRPYLAVVGGVAIATAVICGSLVIGSSVKETLRLSALKRLGKVEYALVAPRFFSQARAKNSGSAPVLMLKGSLMTDQADTALANVNIIGVDPSFAPFFSGSVKTPEAGKVILNLKAATQLGVKVGDDLLISVPKGGKAPLDSLFGRKERSDLRVSVRATVSEVVNGGMGDFALDPSLKAPLNAFLNLEWLAEAVGQKGKCNALLASGENPQVKLNAKLTLEDCGIRQVSEDPKRTMLYSDSFAFPSSVVESAKTAIPKAELGSIYLATRVNAHQASSAYAVVGYKSSLPLAANEVVLTEWLADDLGVARGESVSLEWQVSQPDGTYRTAKKTLIVRKIIVNSRSEKAWTPTFEGLTDASSIGNWNPPFPFESSRITARDEAYWKKYKASPKAWVSRNLLEAMWKGSWVTTLAVPPSSLGNLKPALLSGASGLKFQPVKEQALAAAKGSTDFAELFLALGFFIVVSALAFTAGTLKLAIERRSAQYGLLSALGATEKATRGVMLVEGSFMAVVGSLVGTVLGVLYAALILWQLRHGWSGAVASNPIELHLRVVPLLMSFLIGSVVGFLTVLWTAWRVAKQPTLALLNGQSQVRAPLDSEPSLVGPIAFGVTVLLTLGCGIAAFFMISKRLELFFATGGLALVTGLIGCGLLLDRSLQSVRGLRDLAKRNLSVRKGHSLLIIGVLAAASFTLVAVAPYARIVGRDELKRKDSGAGGFSLVVTTSSPVPFDLASPAGRLKLGFGPDDEAALKGIEAVSFLMQEGDDTSCLNLAKPRTPRIIGVSSAMIKRGGFVLDTVDGKGWKSLLGTAQSKTLPVFGDSVTVEWVLHSGLGQTYSLTQPKKELRFTGVVQKSLFARELLVSESAFRRMYPTQTGPRYFLIATPKGNEAQVAQALRRNLADMGVEVEPVSELMQSIMGVQNTYIQTFLALGGLGLLLGTFGLASALFRNAHERRKEIALMAACGFKVRDIVRLLVLEHAGLMLWGVLIGAGSALIAIAPMIGAAAPWGLAVGMILAILVFGWVVCHVAGRLVLKGISLEALRSE